VFPSCPQYDSTKYHIGVHTRIKLNVFPFFACIDIYLYFRELIYLSEVQDYWQNKADGEAQQLRKWSQSMGRIVWPPPLILIRNAQILWVEYYTVGLLSTVLFRTCAYAV
jgi:hypothetical protein